MTWAFVIGLSAGAYALKALGLLVLPRLSMVGRAAPLVAFLPAALLMALVVVGTFELDGSISVDARLLGVVAAAVAALLRAPIVVVIVIAPTITALVRLL